MTQHQFCGQCGKPIAQGARFCGACGAAVATEAPASARSKEHSPEGRTRKPLVLALAGAGVALALIALLLAGNDTPQPGPERASRTARDSGKGLQGGGTAGSAGPGSTATPTTGAWQTYSNARYGAVVDYPAELFSIEEAPPDNAGRSFSARRGNGRFFVYSHANALERRPDALFAEEVADFGGGLADKRQIRGGFLLSGTIGSEFVIRRILLNEEAQTIHRLEIAFPVVEAETYKDAVPRMIASFRFDPSVMPEGGAAVQDGQGPDEFSYLRIDSRDYGFALDGARSGVGFSVEVPEGWVRETGTLPWELAFRSPDDDPDARMTIAFAVELADGRSPADAAGEHKAEMVSLAGANVVDSWQGTLRLWPAARLTLEMDSPDDADTQLVDALVVFQKGEQLYRVELTAPKPIWHTASQAMERAIASLGFAE